MTETVSINTAHILLELDVKTVNHWIKKLSIETFPDTLDRKKKLIRFKDMQKISIAIRDHGYAPRLSLKPKKYNPPSYDHITNDELKRLAMSLNKEHLLKFIYFIMIFNHQSVQEVFKTVKASIKLMERNS